MTKLLMYLLADDYGLINYFVFKVLIIVIFILFISKEDGTPVFSCSYIMITIVTTISVFFLSKALISPKEISEYGTDAQKQKMVYCVQHYMKRNGV